MGDISACSSSAITAPKSVAQKFHFGILRIEVTRASRGLSGIAELATCTNGRPKMKSSMDRGVVSWMGDKLSDNNESQ